jgi:hypothetical protein
MERQNAFLVLWALGAVVTATHASVYRKVRKPTVIYQINAAFIVLEV